MVGDQLVFSDSEGKFQARFRNQKESERGCRSFRVHHAGEMGLCLVS